MAHKLTKEQIAAIEKVLDADNRVEVVPVANGVKLLEIKRKEVK